MSTIPEDKSRGPFSRRRFLGSVGLGATGVAIASSIELGRVGVARSAAAESETETPGDRFGRMFRLPSFAEPTAQVKEALLEMGRPGGLLDAQDNLGRGPVDLIVDPVLSANNPDNPLHTAGATFMGPIHGPRHDLRHEFSSGYPNRAGKHLECPYACL